MLVETSKDLCEQLAGKVVHNLLKNAEELTFSVREDVKKRKTHVINVRWRW